MGLVPAWILRKGTIKEQSLPRPPSHVSSGQAPQPGSGQPNTGGLSTACSPWEEESLNIRLLTREEL